MMGIPSHRRVLTWRSRQ